MSLGGCGDSAGGDGALDGGAGDSDALADADPGPEPIATPERVGNGYNAFGIYHASPESPDGRSIAFIEYLSRPSRNVGAPFDLWVCDVGRTSCRVVVEERDDPTINHNGAYQLWVTDQLIAYSPYQQSPTGEVTASTKVVDVDAPEGQRLVHGPYRNAFLGDSTHGGKILIQVFGPDDQLDVRGLWELDTGTRAVRLLVSVADLAPRTGIDPALLHYTHATYSPDGARIAFLLQTANAQAEHLFTCPASQCVASAPGFQVDYWGADKPMHFVWFDGDTFAGHDDRVADGHDNDRSARRWSLGREVVETLAGPGNHIALSPDRSFIASESWYQTDPTRFVLYRRGEATPLSEVFTVHNREGWDDWEMIWVDNAHVNPAFSRDGTRLYFKQPAGGDHVRAYVLDLRGLLALYVAGVEAGATEGPGEPTAAVDGDDSTVWRSADDLEQAWIELDLGGHRDLRRVDLHLEGDPGRSQSIGFDVDGVEAVSLTVPAGQLESVPVARPGRRLRIRLAAAGEDGSRSLALRSVTVYGRVLPP